MALPVAARQQFLERGYAIVPNAISSPVIQTMRNAVVDATLARRRYFAHLPAIDSFLRTQSKFSDPLYDKMRTQIEKRRYILRYYRQAKRDRRALRKLAREFLNGRTRDQLTRDDLSQLSKLLAAHAAKPSGRHCTSTIHNDGQMLQAINQYRANAWMSSDVLRDVVFKDESRFVAPLNALAEFVGGVDKPVVFGDLPILREAFGNAIGYHCTAPQIGVRTNARRGGSGMPAVTLLIFTYQPTSLCLPPYVLENSHRFVREQYIRQVPPTKLFSEFLPMESHVPVQLQHFQFDETVVARSLLDRQEFDAIGPGTVMVVDPHLMMAFGPNLTAEKEVVYRLNVVSERAPVFLKSPSWIRGWRTVPHEVSFASPIVFPPLYTAATQQP